jgi:hypothetical protein
VIGRQPLPHIRRQQEPLLTPALDEVLRHPRMVLSATDGPRLRDSLDEKRTL